MGNHLIDPMRRLAVILGSVAAGLVCRTGMDLACLMDSCPTQAGFIWNRGYRLATQEQLRMFVPFALLYVVPTALVVRARFAQSVLAALVAGLLCSALALASSWREADGRLWLLVIHYGLPHWMAWTVYAYVVVRFWPRSRLRVHPFLWCLGSAGWFICFTWASAPRGIAQTIPVNPVEVAENAALYALVFFPVWLPALLGARRPRLARGVGALMFGFAVAFPILGWVRDGPLISYSFWWFSSAAALIGFAHVTLRSSGRAEAAVRKHS